MWDISCQKEIEIELFETSLIKEPLRALIETQIQEMKWRVDEIKGIRLECQLIVIICLNTGFQILA